MKQKTIIFSVFIGIVLILVGFTPATISEQPIRNLPISIESTIFNNGNSNKIIADLNLEEAEQLKETLLELNNAINQKDQETIQHCLIELKNFGVIDDIQKIKLFPIEPESVVRHQTTNKLPILERLYEKFSTSVVDNTMCLVNVAGKGFMLFTIGVLLTLPTLLLLDLFGQGIFSLLIPLYVIIAIITHAIPFRILLPVGIINLDYGSISTRGINGHQQINATNQSVTATLIGFTGITINIPFGQDEGFTFVAGFSILARADYS